MTTAFSLSMSVSLFLLFLSRAWLRKDDNSCGTVQQTWSKLLVSTRSHLTSTPNFSLDLHGNFSSHLDNQPPL
ncbi:hypothetical protein B0J18DRAFT_254040 [Chaetomium sp. MPI-SDFR-AT-0129]|nr:hypothetical protein B0J18DRAFT_254040 [Chaetomium sp. MPI-SDFR-AT-0129]